MLYFPFSEATPIQFTVTIETHQRHHSFVKSPSNAYDFLVKLLYAVVFLVLVASAVTGDQSMLVNFTDNMMQIFMGLLKLPS